MGQVFTLMLLINEKNWPHILIIDKPGMKNTARLYNCVQCHTQIMI